MRKKRLASMCLAAAMLSCCVFSAHAEVESNPNDRIAAGEFHTVWLGEDNLVNAIGGGGYRGVDQWSDIVKIAAWDVTIGVKEDGTVVIAGDSSRTYRDASDWTDIVDAVAGQRNIVGLTADGKVVALGDNSYKQCDISHWTGITQVAVGARNVYGLRKNGTVAFSGEQYGEQSNVSMWKNIASIAAGSYFVAGLKNDGTVVLRASYFENAADVDEWEDIKNHIDHVRCCRQPRLCHQPSNRSYDSDPR